MPKSSLTRGLREEIAVYLRKDIIAGELAPGAQLVERQLADRFSVSHAPVREALLQLTQEGLLVSQTNRGAQVAPSPSRSIRRVFAPIRETLETHALQQVFDRLDEDALRRWGTILSQLEYACRRADSSAVAQLDYEFHQWIVVETAQPEILSAWRAAIARARLEVREGVLLARQICDVYPDHEQIIELCRSGDMAGAVEALKRNIAAEALAH